MGTDTVQRRRPAKALDRRVLKMWWTTWGVLVAIGAAVASPLLGRSPGLTAAYVIGVLSAIVLAAAIPYLRYRRWRYEIRERDLFLSRGSLFFVLTLIPFDRIQYVETHRGPLDLAFGLMQLVVYTAAGRAARIPGLAPDEAGSLREELSKVAGTQSV
ncbi:MAG: PH domain-containing protein [Actinobacteria bacterium]|nr:PH domain-containing protein [Actinomycetota bacterium]